ncbi:hypothetical protein AG0111_0g10138 [Alternaria gaisen]|uniref:Uncharacterized protein n=1 Tax=Alternaria gaisen TaxID=167740 RepID=A0ACB6FAV2_9PLEO|nr:hypothetical protein AG0111_0g10138 [Alternaria gaisen]
MVYYPVPKYISKSVLKRPILTSGVPGDMVGKLNRLYRLRSKYDTAVSNSDNPRISAVVLSAGAKLARCQRQFNLELATRRRTDAHTGTPMGVPTQVPKTSADFLSLILVEQRRIAVALEQAVKHLAHSNGMAGESDDSDDSDDPSTPGDGESQAGGSGSAGGSNSGSEGGEEEETGGNGETGGGGGEGVEGDGGN